MHERIKQIRKALNLTQEEFGKRIGYTRGAVTNIELQKVEPKPLMLDLICREFNVNEQWLRTGEGEMFVQHSRDEEIARFFGEVLKDERDDFRRRLIHALSKLSVDEWDMIERRARELLVEDDEAQKKTGP